MYSLSDISCERFHLFKEASFQFRDGISQVAGENTSGKSLLFAVIPTMLSLIHNKDGWEAPPKGSTLTMNYRKGETDVSYMIATPSTSKFHLALNNEDAHPHKKADAKNLLLKNWTIPQALFTSTIFLRGVKEHPLMYGTAGDRSKWLSDALDLNARYDDLKTQADRKLEEASKAMSQLNTLQEEKESLLARMPDSQISKKKYEKALAQMERYQSVVSDLPNERQTLDSALNIIEQLQDLPNSVDEPDLEKNLKAARKKLATIEAQLDKIDEIQDDLDHNIKIANKMKAISEKFPKDRRKTLVKWPEYKEEVKRFKEQERITEEFVEQKKAYDAQADWREEIQELAKMMIWGDRSGSLDEAYSKYAKLKSQHEAALESRESFEDLKGQKNCPTCGNSLTKSHIKEEKIRVGKLLKELPEQMKEAKKEIRYWKLFEEKRVRKPSKPEFSYKEHAELGRFIEAYEAFQELKSTLRKVEEIPSGKLPKIKSKLEKRIDRYERLMKAQVKISSLRSMLPKTLRELSDDELNTWKVNAEERLATIKDELIEASDIVSSSRSTISTYESERRVIKNNQSILNGFEEKIVEYQKLTKYAPKWKALSEAFGSRGVRLMDLREAAATFAAQLTELSSLFFKTTYHFRIEVKPGTLNIVAERNGKEGSIQTLSGFESRSWSLLCAMAMMRIIPNYMRCDTMILDEIEANMDQNSRDRYVKDVIPELQSVVKKIVVITPLMNGELSLKPDFDYRVIKTHKNGEYRSQIHAV